MALGTAKLVQNQSFWVGRAVAWVLLGAGIAWYIHLILISTNVPLWDQWELVLSPFSLHRYPPLDWGISSKLLAEAYKAGVHPDPSRANQHISIFIMALYAVSALWMAQKYLTKATSLIAFILLLFSSRFLNIWVSTELVAGTFLCLFATLMKEKKYPVGAGFVLAMLGLSRPDLIVLAAVLLVYAWKYWPRPARARLVWSWTLFCTLLVVPGPLLQGSAYFTRATQSDCCKDYGASRSFYSFGQHYAWLASSFQLSQPGPDPAYEWNQYTDAAFPGVKTMAGVIRHFPGRYRDFLCLSLAKSVQTTLSVFWPLFFFIPCWRMARTEGTAEAGPLEKILLLCLIAFIPYLAFSYVQPRYLAKFYPLAVLWMLTVKEKLSSHEQAGWRPSASAFCGWLLLAVFAANSLKFYTILTTSDCYYLSLPVE
jgi:hypothetical protein